MDFRNENDSDEGGGHNGRSPPSASAPGTPRDERRPRDGPPDPGPSGGQAPHAAAVLSLEHIRITRVCNEYTDGPTVAQVSPASQQRRQKSDSPAPPGSSTGGQQETREERPNNLRNLHSQHGTASVPSREEGVSRSSGAEDSQSSVGTSVGSASSGQRLIGGEPIIRTQPKRAELNAEELKPLNDECRALVTNAAKQPGKHSSKCESCGRCQCSECTCPRVLPSCWMCGRRCVCSAQDAVEYGTCVCCVKGLFYHCSSDDEDTCADKPFSCSPAHRCARWATVSLLAVLFPCLLCYLPAKGCVAACQSCYDRAARPGCRCKDTNPGHCQGAGKQNAEGRETERLRAD